MILTTVRVDQLKPSPEGKVKIEKTPKARAVENARSQDCGEADEAKWQEDVAKLRANFGTPEEQIVDEIIIKLHNLLKFRHVSHCSLFSFAII